MRNSCPSRFLIHFSNLPTLTPGRQHFMYWFPVLFIPFTFSYSYQNIPCWVCPHAEAGDEVSHWSYSSFPQSLIFLSLGLRTWGSGFQRKGSEWTLPDSGMASFLVVLEFRLPIQTSKSCFQDMMSQHFVCLSIIKLDCIVFHLSPKQNRVPGGSFGKVPVVWR